MSILLASEKKDSRVVESLEVHSSRMLDPSARMASITSKADVSDDEHSSRASITMGMEVNGEDTLRKISVSCVNLGRVSCFLCSA
jgi:hypothetical protein